MVSWAQAKSANEFKSRKALLALIGTGALNAIMVTGCAFGTIPIFTVITVGSRFSAFPAVELCALRTGATSR